MKALYAQAAHDLRLEPFAAAAPGPNEGDWGILRGAVSGSDLQDDKHVRFGPVRACELVAGQLSRPCGHNQEWLGAGFLAPSEAPADGTTAYKMQRAKRSAKKVQLEFT